MSTVLDRESLAESPLADLHFLANELGVDGFRRLRKADLIDAIIARQSADGGVEAPEAEADADAEPSARSRRGGADADADADASAAPPEAEADTDADAPARTPEAEADADAEAPARGRRRRRGAREAANGDVAATEEPEAELETEEDEDGSTDEDAPARTRRGRRGGRGRRTRTGDLDPASEPAAEEPAEEGGDRIVEGVVELLGNGSAFVRLTAPEPTDDDVYVSAAQVKRCELVSGDRIGGPVTTTREPLPNGVSHSTAFSVTSSAPSARRSDGHATGRSSKRVPSATSSAGRPLMVSTRTSEGCRSDRRGARTGPPMRSPETSSQRLTCAADT